jgi:cytochrome c
MRSNSSSVVLLQCLAASHSLLVSLITLCSAFADEAFDPGRFEKTVVAANLIQPMEIAIAPDGKIYLIELAGSIKVLDPATGVLSTIGQVQVTTAQENGLIGLALDPDFANNHWLYLQYSPPDYIGQHVSRFTLRDGKIDMESESLVLKYEEQRQECCHHAGSMEFGPDGNLYIGTGDNTNPFGDSQGFAPIDEREARGAFNAQRTAANTQSHNGKVLRIKPLAQGGYSIPDGNLFPRDGSKGLPEIYVMGCRNPWRLNIDRKTGFLYWGDVGPDAGSDGPRGPRGYDEVNQARKAGNFGWPHFIGNNRPYPNVTFETGEVGQSFDPLKPINQSVFNTGSRELPPAQPAWIYYPAGASEEFPELGSGGRTACAGPAYDFDARLKSETKFPKEYDRTLFIFEWSRNWIAAVHLDGDSKIRSIEPFLPKMTFTRPIDLQFDQHGSLYVLEYGETWGVNPDARLSRLDYRRGNRNPTARLRANPTAGHEPLIVEFDAKECSDKDNDPLTYRWRMAEANKSIADSPIVGTSDQLRLEFDTPGVFNVQLESIDNHGASGSAVTTIVVGNTIPEVRFVRPLDGDFFDDGQPLKYQVAISDAEDGTSDAEEAERRDREFIDADAPNRLNVQAALIASNNSKEADEQSLAPGLKLIRGSDCLNCHALDRPLVGPTFVEIANKYRDQPTALDVSIERVSKGSTGVWGKVPMLPHAQHTSQQIREMVSWVYQAKPNPGAQSIRGMTNYVTLLEGKTDSKGRLRLMASYQDLGRDAIPSLTGSTTIHLRPRTIQAESADEFQRMMVLASHNSQEGKFLGAIEHGSFIKLTNIPMKHVGGITFRVTSAGVGGEIVVRAGKLDGPELGRVTVEVNGDWDGWYERTVAVTSEAQHLDLFFEFVNEKNRGGLMNIDAIRFVPR